MDIFARAVNDIDLLLPGPGIARGAAAETRPRGAVRARAGRADLLDAL